MIKHNKFIQQREMINTLAKGSFEELRQYFIPSDLTNNDIYSDLQFNINHALKFVATTGNGDVATAKYLLTSPDLDIHADIHFDDDCVINAACYWGHQPLVNYLLHSNELKENAKLPKDMDKIFDAIIMHAKEASNLDQQYEYLCFLIFLVNDCQVRPTENIIKLLKKETHPSLYEPAIKQLAQNELYHSLQEDLNTDEKRDSKRLKI